MTLKLLALFTVLTLSAQASGPALTSNPAQIQFNAGIGQPAPAAINVAVTASPAGPTISAATDQPWLSATPSSSKFAVSVNTAGLAAGTYTGNVRFSAPGYTGSVTKVVLSIASPSNGFVAGPGSPFKVTASGARIYAADFNADGKLDIAVLDGVGGAVAIVLGNGSGGFINAAGIPTQSGDLYAMTIGDFNNDGKPDVALLSTRALTTFLGDGAGGFTAGPAVPVTTLYASLATADFNQDGNQDVAIVSQDQQVFVLLGDGHGAFAEAPGSPFTTPIEQLGLQVGDFNGDGIPDFVSPVVSGSTGGFTVFLGDGTGRFSARSIPAGPSDAALAVADFNGDGILDVVLIAGQNAGSQLFLGDGAGGFTPSTSLSSLITTYGAIAVGDFNGDGKVDLFVGGSEVLLGDGTGKFVSAWGNFVVPGFFTGLAGDFNGDGKLDLVSVNASANGGLVTVMLGSAQTPSSIALSLTSGSTYTIASGQAVSLTASLMSKGFAGPTGSIQFRDGSTVLGTVSLSPSSSSPFLAKFQTTGLPLGQHSFYADYLGDGGTAASSSAATIVNVVVPAPQITVSLNGSTFNQGQMGAQYPINVVNFGTGPTNATITVNAIIPNGLTLVSMAGQGWTCSGTTCTRTDPINPGFNAEIIVTVNVTGNPSTLSTTVTESGGGSAGNTVTGQIAIVTTRNIFGYFDTPADLSTGISGAVNVTGWALSSAGVAGVTLWRDPVGSEPVASYGLVFLANATITPGARPDVAKAFPGYPGNNSGWGAQVLTNLFPNSGNGTFRIHAVVSDNNKNVVDLGAKTITVDNAHATLPFGTLDTPAQDATVSGAAYISFGWALTPNPANVIPTDGSTIGVFIDGAPVGHPVYNNNRQDIATLFPGLQNTNGAVGYFMIDTTKLSNGLHTIAWSVTDSAGNAQGIGNRFFNVQN